MNGATQVLRRQWRVFRVQMMVGLLAIFANATAIHRCIDIDLVLFCTDHALPNGAGKIAFGEKYRGPGTQIIALINTNIDHQFVPNRVTVHQGG